MLADAIAEEIYKVTRSGNHSRVLQAFHGRRQGHQSHGCSDALTAVDESQDSEEPQGHEEQQVEQPLVIAPAEAVRGKNE